MPFDSSTAPGLPIRGQGGRRRTGAGGLACWNRRPSGPLRAAGPQAGPHLEHRRFIPRITIMLRLLHGPQVMSGWDSVKLFSSRKSGQCQANCLDLLIYSGSTANLVRVAALQLMVFFGSKYFHLWIRQVCSVAHPQPASPQYSDSDAIDQLNLPFRLKGDRMCHPSAKARPAGNEARGLQRLGIMAHESLLLASG